MRPIGSLPTESDARRFGDYLLTVGIRNHVEPTRDGGWLVWIEHDDHIEQGQLQLRQYEANPNDPRYAEAESAAWRLRVEAEKAAKKRRKNYTDVRTSWSGVRVGGTPASIVLLILCIVVALLTQLGDALPPKGAAPPSFGFRAIEALVFQPFSALETLDDDSLVKIAGRYPAIMFSSVLHGQVWRLVTPMLLHFGVLHLVFNMAWLMTLWRMIESRKGTLMFVSFVIAAAVISNSGEALWAIYSPWERDGGGYSRFGGFSGVNYALFGYAWMRGRLRPYEHIGVSQQTIGMLLAWLVLCMTGLLGPIANAAHFVGLLVGVVAGAWPTILRKVRP